MHRQEYEGAPAELCAREGVACVPYFALASGFLTGKYRRDAPAPDGPSTTHAGPPGAWL